jgi:hypothetical protein
LLLSLNGHLGSPENNLKVFRGVNLAEFSRSNDCREVTESVRRIPKKAANNGAHEEEAVPMFRTTHAVIGLISLCFLTGAAQAAEETKAAAAADAPAAATDPTVVHTLFETRQLDLIDKGREVVYRFDRKVSDERLLGKGYADDIKLGVKNVGEKGEREVEFKAFTGEQAREPTSWPDLTINPLFIWYLERAVSSFNSLAGGNQMYIKGTFRAALADKAQIEPTKIDLNGKSIDGYKITVTPFADDKNAGKMQGYEKSRFTMLVSKDAPGYFVDLQSTFESTAAAAPKLEERISLVGLAGDKQ